MLPTPALLPGPLPCREEQEGSQHPLPKQDASIPLRKEQAASLGAAGAELKLRRLGRGEGLPALPQRGKRGPLEGLWAGGLCFWRWGGDQLSPCCSWGGQQTTGVPERRERSSPLRALMGNRFLLLSFSHKKLRRLHVPKTCGSAGLSFITREIASWNCLIHVYLNGLIKINT